MIIGVVLAFGMCIMLGGTLTECTVPEPVLNLVGSNVGVVGKSLTLTWNLTIFSDNQISQKASLLVARKGTANFFILLGAKFSNGNVTYTKKKLNTTMPESIFNNITAMKNDGKTKFQLIITSVPSNIESFIFKCKVSYADIWTTPSVKVVSVQLASRPVIVQFKVWNSNGNNTIGGGNRTIGSGNNTIGGVYNTSGGRLEMLCAARGYPVPLVTLKKEYRSQLTEIARSFQNVTYSVHKLKPSDAGRYICIAHNVAATVTKDVIVTNKDAIRPQRMVGGSSSTRMIFVTPIFRFSLLVACVIQLSS